MPLWITVIKNKTNFFLKFYIKKRNINKLVYFQCFTKLCTKVQCKDLHKYTGNVDCISETGCFSPSASWCDALCEQSPHWRQRSSGRLWYTLVLHPQQANNVCWKRKETQKLKHFSGQAVSQSKTMWSRWEAAAVTGTEATMCLVLLHIQPFIRKRKKWRVKPSLKSIKADGPMEGEEYQPKRG